MTITGVLDLQLKPEAVEKALDVLHDILTATRAYEGNLGVDVLVDITDPAHVILLEKWESVAAHNAYQAWRATPEGASGLGDLLAARPTTTQYATAERV